MSSLKLLGEPAGGGPHTHPEADIEDGAILARLAASETVTGLYTFPGLKLTGGIQDSGGTVRVTIATASPQITLGEELNDRSADTIILGRVVLGSTAASHSIDPYSDLVVVNEGAGSRGCGILVSEGFGAGGPGAGNIWGLGGLAAWIGDPAASLCAGLNFEAQCLNVFGTTTLAALEGVRVKVVHQGGEAVTVTNARGLHVLRPWGGYGSPRPTYVTGLYIEDQFSTSGLTTPTNVISIKCDDLSGGTNRYLLELGPATPYLRLIGGAAPGANLTNLYLAEGVTPTLRRVQWKLYSDLVAGDRVMVLV